MDTQNMLNCYWQLFNSVVRPHSGTLRGERIRICVDDEHVIAYMFLKLEQTIPVYSVKSYIRSYKIIQRKAQRKIQNIQ